MTRLCLVNETKRSDPMVKDIREGEKTVFLCDNVPDEL